MYKIEYYIRTFLVAMCLSFAVKSQTVERFAIASVGGEGQSTDAQITWTCGESVTTSLQAGGNLLTQGFQQLYLANTTIAATHGVNSKINVYPVPCTEGFFINGSFAPQKNYSYALYNSLGVCVLKEKLNAGSTFVEIQSLTDGNYYLVVTDESINTNSTYKIIKTR